MRSFARKIVMFLLVAAFAATVTAQVQDARLPKIAGYAYGAKDPALSRAAATRLVTAFVNSGRYKASEEYREFFEYAADGHKYTPAPVSVAQYKLMGQQFGIDYICVAEIATIFGEERLFANLIDVKTATITAMAAGDTPLRKPADLTAASNQIVATMLKIAPPAQPTQQEQPEQPTPVASTSSAPGDTSVVPLAVVSTGQTPEDTSAEQAVSGKDDGGKTKTSRKLQNGVSLAYVYDPSVYIGQMGFTQCYRIAEIGSPRVVLSLAWEANLWGGRRMDNQNAANDTYYGVNIPLLCLVDINEFFVEAGGQLSALTYNEIKTDNINFAAGAVAGVGISPYTTLKVYYRYGYNVGTLNYYSHTIGVRVLF